MIYFFDIFIFFNGLTRSNSLMEAVVVMMNFLQSFLPPASAGKKYSVLPLLWCCKKEKEERRNPLSFRSDCRQGIRYILVCPYPPFSYSFFLFSLFLFFGRAVFFPIRYLTRPSSPRPVPLHSIVVILFVFYTLYWKFFRKPLTSMIWSFLFGGS